MSSRGRSESTWRSGLPADRLEESVSSMRSQGTGHQLVFSISMLTGTVWPRKA